MMVTNGEAFETAAIPSLPLEEFQADVVRGEPVTRGLLAEHGRELRYFRHPFLQVGLELPKRRAFERWLAEAPDHRANLEAMREVVAQAHRSVPPERRAELLHGRQQVVAGDRSGCGGECHFVLLGNVAFPEPSTHSGTGRRTFGASASMRRRAASSHSPHE